MKQLGHKNVLPFYGVSTTVSGFALVFPWYKNRNIMDYLGGNPGVDRYDLASISSLLHAPSAYLTFTTVIRCSERAEVPA